MPTLSPAKLDPALPSSKAVLVEALYDTLLHANVIAAASTALTVHCAIKGAGAIAGAGAIVGESGPPLPPPPCANTEVGDARTKIPVNAIAAIDLFMGVPPRRGSMLNNCVYCVT